MRHVWIALWIGLAGGAATAQAPASPPPANNPVIRPGLPETWIPDRREPGEATAALPDPRLQEPSDAAGDPNAPPAPVGPVCAPKGARQSPEHDEAFDKGLRLIFDGDIPAAIAALQASLDVAADKTEMTLSWVVLGDLYRDEGMTAEAANARQAVAALGCAQPDP